MDGLTRCDAKGRADHVEGHGPAVAHEGPGLGSRYSMRMRVGSADVGGLIEVVEFDEPGDLSWTNVTGIDQRGRWRLRDLRRRAHDASRSGWRTSPRAAYSGSSPTVWVRRWCGGNLERTLDNLQREFEGGGTEVAQPGTGLTGRIGYALGSAKVLVDAGVIRPIRPDKLVKVLTTLARFGRSPAAGYDLARRALSRTSAMIVDELGTLTFGEVHRRTNALAHALSDAGVKEGDGVGIMCRNHRGFIESTVAVSKLGADALYLNTAFAGPQLTEVAQREKPAAIIYDEEFTGLLADAGKRRKRFIAWQDSEKPADPTLEQLIENGRPERRGRAVARGARGDPHLGHHRHAEGRLARRTRRRSTRPCRCCRASRCTAARRSASRRRCSIPGASRTTRSA